MSKRTGPLRATIRIPGFGNAEINRLVERAAVRAVTRLLRRRGFKVVSREKDKIGYDLDATKKRTTLHVEVKGVSGSDIQFPITRAEVRQAETNSSFRLMVVTDARSSCQQIREFKNEEIKRKFQLTPITYMARLTMNE